MWTISMVYSKLVNCIAGRIKFCINHDDLSQSSSNLLISLNTHDAMHQWTSMNDMLLRFNTKLLSSKTEMANYAIPNHLSIIFEIPDDNGRVQESLKDDSDNYGIRGLAILARMNSYNHSN